MDHLKTILGEVINQLCHRLLPETTLRHETLLGVTVDSTSCFTVLLQGGSLYSKDNATTVCLRRDGSECLEMKELVESTLIEACWETISNISCVKIEGTMCVMIDKTDIVLIQIDKTSSIHEVKQVEQNMQQPQDINVPSGVAMVTDMEVMETVAVEDDTVKHEPDDKDITICYMESDSDTEVKIETSIRKAEPAEETVEETGEEAAVKTETAAKKPARRKPGLPGVCEVCGRSFPNSVSLNDHLQEQHQIDTDCLRYSNRSCKYCGKTFSDRRNLRRHNCRIKCQECDAMFSDKIQLNSHIHHKHRLPENAGSLTCHVCYRKCKNWRKLSDHRALHEIDTMFNLSLRKLVEMSGQKSRGSCSCVLCDRVFEYQYHMKRHMLTQHRVHGHLDRRNIVSESNIKLTPDKYKKLFIGPVKRLANICLSKLTYPCMKSGNEYTCLMCRQVRLTHINIMSHFERHLLQIKYGKTDSKRYNKITGSEFVLVKKTFPCYICLRKFVSERTLAVHMLTNHEQGNRSGAKLVCQICNKKFVNSSNLFTHLDKHRFKTSRGETYSSVKPLQCKECHKAYANKENLLLHYREVHGRDLEQEMTVDSTVSEVGISPLIVVQSGSATSTQNGAPAEEPATVRVETIGVAKTKKKPTKRRKRLTKPRKGSSERVMCMECGATCCKTSLKLHMKRWHGDVKHDEQRASIQCPICGKLFSDKKFLTVHLHKHSNVNYVMMQ